jgi:hypothetical protein
MVWRVKMIYKNIKIIISILFVYINLGSADHVPNTFIKKIADLLKREQITSEFRWIKKVDVIINYEKENQIGTAWYNYSDSVPGSWAYNYIRFDTTGNILLDLRNFVIKNTHDEKFNYLSDPYYPYPDMEYLTDSRGNSIIAYSYPSDRQNERWKLAWIKVDSMSNIYRNDLDGSSSNYNISICLSKKFNFHFILGNKYYDLVGSDHIKSDQVNVLNYKFFNPKIKPHLLPPNHFIETSDNNILCLSQSVDSYEIHYQRISPKGKPISRNRIKINSVRAVIWDNVELPEFEELFHWNDSIWYITSTQSVHLRDRSRLTLILFDKKGNITKHKVADERRLFSIDSMPIDSKRFVKIVKDTIYYFGFDHQGNLYYWNSRWGYIDYNRVNIFAPFYSIHYNNVRDELYNPQTEDNLYPDSMNWLNRWTSGGKMKYDMKLLIGCNNTDKTYLTGEPMGIRCGIIHAILNKEIYLGKAYYSPNKHFCPPEVTIYINAPENADEKQKHLGYMGDDVGFGDRLKVDSVKVPAGKIFNPSPDNLFYNTWSGIYKFDVPGIYKIWCSYTFDSLTSSIKVDKLDTLFSDTLEITVKDK